MNQKFYTMPVFLLLFFAASFAVAQSYTITPGKVYSATIETNEPTTMQIDFNNTDTNSIVLDWVQLSNTFHANWSAVFCDYGNCWPSIPASGSMTNVPGNGKGFFKLTINAGTFIWSGSVSLTVQQPGFPLDTVTFNVTSIVGVENRINDHVAMYPNPASDVLTIASVNGLLDAGTITISDLRGSAIKTAIVGAVPTIELGLAEFSNGMYIVRYDTEYGSVARKFLVNK